MCDRQFCALSGWVSQAEFARACRFFGWLPQRIPIKCSEDAPEMPCGDVWRERGAPPSKSGKAAASAEENSPRNCTTALTGGERSQGRSCSGHSGEMTNVTKVTRPSVCGGHVGSTCAPTRTININRTINPSLEPLATDLATTSPIPLSPEIFYVSRYGRPSGLGAHVMSCLGRLLLEQALPSAIVLSHEHFATPCCFVGSGNKPSQSPK